MTSLDPRSETHQPATKARRLRAVPPADSLQTLGPQHAAILELVAALPTLTPEQDAAIEQAWYDRRGPERFTARGLASQAASDNGRLEQQITARQLVWSASAHRCRDAAGDAAHALAVADLAGQAFPKSVYDELLHPWASVMGAPAIARVDA